MTKQDINFIKNKLSILIGQPLQSFDRAGPLAVLEFGDLVESSGSALTDEKGSFLRDENNRVLFEETKSGRYLFLIDAALRFSIGNDIITGNYDMFVSSDEVSLLAESGVDFSNFNWEVDGNVFDERLEKHFYDKDYTNYIVKDINITKFGDMDINFENGFTIKIFCDCFTGVDDWSFSDLKEEISDITVANGRLKKEA